MSPERWQQVKELLDEALQREPQERERFLDEACAGDDELRGEVSTLLVSFNSGESFMERPVIGEVAEFFVEEQKRLSAGQHINHYKIISQIGAGGMGEVYLAEDTKLKRKVALKLLPAEFTNDNQRLVRFEQEARAASALNHPNIITIHEIGADGGLHFIATEYIVGQTLREKLKANRLNIGEALEISQQVTNALVAAHQASIVHRDIKPENIMIRPDGLVKVLDFGLAKLTIAPTDSVNTEAETIAKGMTKPGTILGTLHYMSPEQVRGMPLDARSDIFSLGVVMYEMLTGKEPFDKPTPSDVIAAILTENPPMLSQERSEIPPELQRIITKVLNKNKEERYQTSKDLLIDIKSLTKEIEFEAKLIHSTGGAAAATRRTSETTSQLTTIATARRFSFVHALAILLVAGLAIGAIWWFALRDNQTVNPSSLKTVEVVSWRSAPGEVYSIGSLSPDGKVIAFTSTKVGTNNIWVKQTGSGEAVQITKDEFRNDKPIWSPNGEEIAFFSMRGNQPGIWRMPYLSGTTTLIKTVDDSGAIPRYWSNKDVIYYESKQNLFAIDIKSGQSSQVTNLDSTKVNPNTVVISPDEEHIAYVTTEGEQWSVWAGGRDASFKQIVKSANEIRNTVWHSDCERILYSANVDGIFQIFVIDVNGRKPTQITFSDRDSFVLGVSTDGEKVLYGSSKEESDVWGVNVEKGEEFAFASDLNSELWADVSPDNKTVAFQSIKNLSQGDKLFSGAILTKQKDSDAQPVQLVANGFLPTWSPDGKQLAFMRVSGGTYNLWTIKATGGEEKQLTTNGLSSVENTILPYNRAQESYFSWSPDSSKIAYISNKSGQRNIWLVSADGSSDTQLTSNNDANLFLYCPLWSSDGKRIAYSSKPNKASPDGKRIYTASVIDIETKTSKAIFQSENFQRLLGWSSEEKELILATINRKSGMGLPTEVSIIQVNVETGEQRTINTLQSAYLYNIHLSFDRKMIAFAAHRDDKDNVWIMPSNGGEAKRLTNNNDSRLYFSSMSWSPDGRSIYFGKQSRFSLLSMITNFK
jgi:serine/threonine protein kinase